MKLRTLCLSLALASGAIAANPQVASPQTSDSARRVDAGSDLAAAKKELSEMLTRYTEKHPAVIKQRQKIKALEKAASPVQTAPATATK
ncbi:MAG TPA: hypothetical protein VGE76_02080 [Opitutaceae bacterium]